MQIFALPLIFTYEYVSYPESPYSFQLLLILFMLTIQTPNTLIK